MAQIVGDASLRQRARLEQYYNCTFSILEEMWCIHPQDTNRRPNPPGLPVELVGDHILPSGIPARETVRIEPYSLLMVLKERDSLSQSPFDSTLTVGIIPSLRASHPKHLKYFLLYLSVLACLIPRVPLWEAIHQPNSCFLWGIYNLPCW